MALTRSTSPGRAPKVRRLTAWLTAASVAGSVDEPPAEAGICAAASTTTRAGGTRLNAERKRELNMG